jgi:type I restriction enzyme S subunit
MGALGVARHTGIVSPAYGVYRPLTGCALTPRYADHLLRTPIYAGEYLRRSTGVNSSRLRLYPEQFLRIPVAVPPPEEQEAMVRFLDHANGRLERAIRAKRKVIALLHEQKQAIIHRAVTRGLDPTVPLKPSGIHWLGDIPKHWGIRRLKYLAIFQSGDSITSLQIEPQGDYPVYGGNGLRGYTNHYTHDGHFALIGRQGALCGNINYADGKFFASEHAVVATLRPAHSVIWFGELLKVMNLNQYSQSAAQPGLAVERIKNLAAPVPPATEQPRIVLAFQNQTSGLTTAMTRLDREISLLREYRTRLVADVVTGNLDVRPAARQLLTEPAETETAISVEEDTNEDLELEPEAADG